MKVQIVKCDVCSKPNAVELKIPIALEYAEGEIEHKFKHMDLCAECMKNYFEALMQSSSVSIEGIKNTFNIN